MNILGIGVFEILVIFLVAFLILGPEKMSEFSKSFAKFVRKIRDEKDELTSIIDESAQSIKDEKDELTSIIDESAQSIKEEIDGKESLLNDREKKK